MFNDLNALKTEVLRIRAMLLAGLIIYPSWSFILTFLAPEIPAYHGLRNIITGLVFIALVLSFFIKSKLVQFLNSSLMICSLVAIVHGSWFLYMTRAHYIEYCGFIILTATLVSVAPSKRAVACFAIPVLLFTLMLSQIDRQWLINPYLIPIGLFIALVPSMLASFTRINHINEIKLIQKQQDILFANLEEGVVVLNEDGCIENTNSAALRFFNISAADLKNSRSLENAVISLGRLSLSAGETFRQKTVEFLNDKKEINWFFANAVTYYTSTNVKKCVVTFSDITFLKNSEAVILNQKEQLSSTSKLSTLGEMASGIAHEINNPLAIIVGKIALISREIENNSIVKSEAHLKSVVDMVMRIKNIIKGLQTFARGGEHEPFNSTELKPLVTEVISFCFDKIRTLEVKIDLSIPGELRFDCRSGQISQVLLNLISNACDAVKNLEKRWILISAEEFNGKIRIYVSDSGNGISADLQEKIMQPFFTTKELGKGTGLGLSISQGIIQSHQGRLELIRNSGPTTFMIEIPVQQHQAVVA